MKQTMFQVAMLLPFAVLVAFVAGVTPDFPLLDDWSFTEFTRSVVAGEAGLRDWVAPHNASHVVVVPRLVISGLTLATSGSGRAVLLASVALVAWTAFALFQMVRSSPAATNRLTPWMGLATMLLLCSPVSYRAFIWPIAFCHFLVNASVLTMAWCLSRPVSSITEARFVVAVCAGIVATTTRAEGVFTWIVFLPLVWQLSNEPSQRARFVGTWGIAAAAFIGLFVYSIVALSPEKSSALPSSLLAQPIETIGNALGLIGMAFGAGFDGVLGDALSLPRRYFWFGIPVVLGYVVFGARGLLSSDSEIRRAAWPWVLVGLFGGLYVGATSAARVGVLERNFLADIWPSNYSVTAGLVGVATFQLAALVSSPAGRDVPAARRVGDRLATGAAVITIVVLIGAAASRAPDALRERTRSRNAAVCWELFEHLAPINTCFLRKPTRADIRGYVDLGFVPIRDDVRFIETASPETGTIEVLVPRPGGGEAEAAGRVGGWVATNDNDADARVFVSVDSYEGLFAYATMSEAASGRANWSVSLPSLVAGSRVRAFVYRREEGVLEPIAGEVQLGAISESAGRASGS